MKRPPEPNPRDTVRYRGWEVAYEADDDFWTGEDWHAYQGGIDLDARHVSSATYESVLDAVDDEESVV